METVPNESQGSNELTNEIKPQPPHPGRIGNLIRANWPAYIVEIFVIIIGISLSFLIDGYKEDSERKEVEKIYLKNLLLDINRDIESLDRLIEGSRRVVNSAKFLLKYSDPKEKNELSIEDFTMHWINTLYQETFFPSEATFVDLKSGNTRFITDQALRSKLFAYYTLTQYINHSEMREQDGMIGIIQPYFFNNIHVTVDKNNKSIALPGNNDWKLLQSGGFVNRVATRMFDREGLTDRYEEALRIAYDLKGKS